MIRRPWTSEEDDLLRSVYPTRGGCERLRALLPHRTAQALRARAQHLGVRSQPQWSIEEDAILRREWQELGMRSMRAKLRGRTWLAICLRAKRLGLPTGTPQGCCTIREAARRAGYSPEGLTALLRRQGVQVKMRPGWTATTVSRKHFCVVWDDVVAAIAAEQRADAVTVGEAAERIGRSHEQTRRLLRAAGIPLPGRGRKARLTTADVQRIQRMTSPRRAA